MTSEAPALMLVVSRHDQPEPGDLWAEPDRPTAYWGFADVEPAMAAEEDPVGSAFWVGEQLHPGRLVASRDAGAVLAVFQEPVPAYEDEFNEWMDAEHVPALGSVPGVLTARRFRAHWGEPRYLGLYHLAAAEVCESEAWRSASDTPWRARIRPHTHRRARHLLVRPSA